MKEFQPFSTYSAYKAEPGEETTISLSGGDSIPFVYSLGVGSTVPYVRLIGSSKGQKLFSWTEKIIVPPGEMVTIQNASYHTGDIQIQSGVDAAAIPARVTVPIGRIQTQPAKDVWENVPTSKLDTRRARRAFLAGFPDQISNVQFNYVGRAKERSHFVSPVPSAYPGRRAQYVDELTMPIGAVGLIPLGHQARLGDPAHVLLDELDWLWHGFINLAASDNGALYYVLEYL